MGLGAERQVYWFSKIIGLADPLFLRSRTAVDLLNAAMLLLKLECGQFWKQREDVWSKENELTPRGKMEYDEVFEGVNYEVFSINIVERMTFGTAPCSNVLWIKLKWTLWQLQRSFWKVRISELVHVDWTNAFWDPVSIWLGEFMFSSVKSI